MNPELIISTDWERLEGGSEEERACFAAVGIRCADSWLSEGQDSTINRIRAEPLLSAYHLAEWVAWNWWRLRWEPLRTPEPGWSAAHRLSAIGGGYVWPNLSIYSDGERVTLRAAPTRERQQTLFRYISEANVTIEANQFENGVIEFVERVLGKLQAEGIDNTDLDDIWSDVTKERNDPEETKRRKIEALLGFDPDDAPEETLASLLRDADHVGESASDEIAADHAFGGTLPTVESLVEQANEDGFDSSPNETASLDQDTELPIRGRVPAWRLGADAAKAIREQVGMADEPVSNTRLAEMAAIKEGALTERNVGNSFSYALDRNGCSGKVVFRSKWEQGRRFELARLLGDRLLDRGVSKLYPATRAYTYRQKLQRSFAAEFLSPFDSVEAFLEKDYSTERQQEAAQYFQVSEFAIRTLLVNKHRVDRAELEDELEPLAS